MLDEQADEWSERYMLELDDPKVPGITKTTQFSLRDGDARSQQTPSIKEQV